ncbi:MAG: cupin domain-containing protein [Aureliella sp.]
MSKANLEEKFAQFSDHWNPRIVAELNGQQVKVAKLLGEFDWHAHQAEDELFWVIRGELKIELENDSICLGPNELYVVPRGVQHRPVATEEVWVVLFEPASTINTGEVASERTRTDLERL